MVSKNNWEVQMKRGANKVKRYTIKRTSVGVVSAVVAAGLIFGQETSVQADEITAGESQVTEVSSEEAIETDESVVVEETTPSETSAVEATVEENVATEESIVEEVPTTEEAPAEQVYEEVEPVVEESSTESYDLVADEAVAAQEVAVESETTVVENEAVQEETEPVDAQAKMTTFATSETSIVEEDTEFPEFVSISTDKQIYRAGEDVRVTAIVKENRELDYVYANFSRLGNSDVGLSYLSDFAHYSNSEIVENIDGTYTAEIIIKTDEKMRGNTYQLDYVSIKDTASNNTRFYPDTNQSGVSDLTFEIVNEDADTEFPEFVSISTDKQIYQAGEDVRVTAIVKENRELDYVYANFSRLGNSDVGLSYLSDFAHYSNSEIVENIDGTYTAEIIIKTDEKMRGNTYQLDYVSIKDTASNNTRFYPDINGNGMSELVFTINAANVPYEIIREVNPDLTPGSEDVVAQVGVKGSADAITGEIINSPISEIIHYAPIAIEYDVERNFNPEMTPNFGDTVIQYGAIGLVDPETNEVITEPVTEIIEYGPITIGYGVDYQTDNSLEPNSEQENELQVGSEGLQNPETGEVIKEPVNQIISIAPIEEIDDTTVQNIITIIDQKTNQEIASTTFLGNEYSVRLNYFINQLNSQNDLELEVVDEKTTSDVLRSSTVNGFTVSSRTIKKNIYVVNHNNTDTTIEKPFLPEGIIYNNQDNGRAYRKVTIQDNDGRELYRVNYVAYESTDETIRNAMSNINSSDYYYDSVDVSEGFTSIVGSTGSYRGPLKEITILVNRIEEPETPVEPEVPEVEEPETPVEPEVPEVEEPETPVEPEV
ncbi:YSIRK-type signal peptide-containing protein, partial [Aerococcus viridans]